MTNYRWEPVDHALREVFRDVLSEHGRIPPILLSVAIEMDQPIRGDATIIAEFDTTAAQRLDRRKVLHGVGALREGWLSLKRRVRGRVQYEAHNLYTEEIENHLLNLDLRERHEQLAALAQQTNDPGVLAFAQAQHSLAQQNILHNHHLQQGRRLWPEQQMLAEQYAAEVYGSTLTSYADYAYDAIWTTATLRPGTIDNDINTWGAVGDEEANKKGIELLKSHLTPEQIKTYEEKNYFEVKGGSSGKTYRINHGRQMNIHELDAGGKPIQGWCFLPRGALVAGDVMLAQKNALELYEDKALRIANKFPVVTITSGAAIALDQQRLSVEQQRVAMQAQQYLGTRFVEPRGILSSLFGGVS